MNVEKIVQRFSIKPSPNKNKKLKETVNEFKALPKSEPIERDIFIKTEEDIFEESKNRIQNSIDNMRGICNWDK